MSGGAAPPDSAPLPTNASDRGRNLIGKRSPRTEPTRTRLADASAKPGRRGLKAKKAVCLLLALAMQHNQRTDCRETTRANSGAFPRLQLTPRCGARKPPSAVAPAGRRDGSHTSSTQTGACLSPVHTRDGSRCGQFVQSMASQAIALSAAVPAVARACGCCQGGLFCLKDVRRCRKRLSRCRRRNVRPPRSPVGSAALSAIASVCGACLLRGSFRRVADSLIDFGMPALCTATHSPRALVSFATSCWAEVTS